MKKFVVSEDVEIVLDGKKYLLEAGDHIVLEDLNDAEKDILASKIGSVDSADEYWDALGTVKKFLLGIIGKAKKAAEITPEKSKIINKRILDVKEFLDYDLDEFVMSLATPSVQQEINADKISRSDKSADQQNLADMLQTIETSKRDSDKELKQAFGETPEEWRKRRREERDEDRLFESIRYLSLL